MAIFVNASGSLREVVSVFTNDNGNLREVPSLAVNDNGNLREVPINIKSVHTFTASTNVGNIGAGGGFISDPVPDTYRGSDIAFVMYFTDVSGFLINVNNIPLPDRPILDFITEVSVEGTFQGGINPRTITYVTGVGVGYANGVDGTDDHFHQWPNIPVADRLKDGEVYTMVIRGLK